MKVSLQTFDQIKDYARRGPRVGGRFISYDKTKVLNHEKIIKPQGLSNILGRVIIVVYASLLNDT